MKCINCGEDIKKDDKYCPKCGEKTNINKEDILLKAYIGDGYEKIKEESFSIPAFLLGPIYMFYRKLYAYAILSISLLLLFVNLSFMNEISIIISLLVFYLLYGIFFNKIYMKEVKRRVNNIKNKNDKLKEKELIELCKYNGKPTIIVPIIYVLSIILAIGLLLLYDYTYYIEPIATLYDLSGEEEYVDYYEDETDNIDKVEESSSNNSVIDDVTIEEGEE